MLLLEEVFVQVQALQPLQQRVPGPRCQPISVGLTSWMGFAAQRQPDLEVCVTPTYLGNTGLVDRVGGL